MRSGRLPGFAASPGLVWLKGFGDLPEIRSAALDLVANWTNVFEAHAYYSMYRVSNSIPTKGIQG